MQCHKRALALAMLLMLLLLASSSSSVRAETSLDEAKAKLEALMAANKEQGGVFQLDANTVIKGGMLFRRATTDAQREQLASTVQVADEAPPGSEDRETTCSVTGVPQLQEPFKCRLAAFSVVANVSSLRLQAAPKAQKEGCQLQPRSAASSAIIVRRGGCPFTDKAVQAARAAADALLVVNSDNTLPVAVGTMNAPLDFPVAIVGDTVGSAILEQLEEGGGAGAVELTLTVTHWEPPETEYMRRFKEGQERRAKEGGEEQAGSEVAAEKEEEVEQQQQQQQQEEEEEEQEAAQKVVSKVAPEKQAGIRGVASKCSGGERLVALVAPGPSNELLRASAAAGGIPMVELELEVEVDVGAAGEANAAVPKLTGVDGAAKALRKAVLEYIGANTLPNDLVLVVSGQRREGAFQALDAGQVVAKFCATRRHMVFASTAKCALCPDSLRDAFAKLPHSNHALVAADALPELEAAGADTGVRLGPNYNVLLGRAATVAEMVRAADGASDDRAARVAALHEFVEARLPRLTVDTAQSLFADARALPVATHSRSSLFLTLQPQPQLVTRATGSSPALLLNTAGRSDETLVRVTIGSAPNNSSASTLGVATTGPVLPRTVRIGGQLCAECYWDTPSDARSLQVSSATQPSSFPMLSGDTLRAWARFVVDNSSMQHSVEYVEKQMQAGDVAFVAIESTATWFKEYHPRVSQPYVLVSHNPAQSGDAEAQQPTLPGQWADMLSNPSLLAWWMVDPSPSHDTHPKVHALPYGLSNRYWVKGTTEHHVASRAQAPPVADKKRRKIMLYVPLSEQADADEEEEEGGKEGGLVATLSRNVPGVYVQPRPVELSEGTTVATERHKEQHKEHLRLLRESRFVVVSHTWAPQLSHVWTALLHGCVPVVPAGPDGLSPAQAQLYRGTPVMVVPSLHNLTRADLVAHAKTLRQLRRGGVAAATAASAAAEAEVASGSRQVTAHGWEVGLDVSPTYAAPWFHRIATSARHGLARMGHTSAAGVEPETPWELTWAAVTPREALQRAALLTQPEVAALCAWGARLLFGHKLRGALETMEKAVSLFPDSVCAHGELGNVLYALARHSDAALHFRVAHQLLTAVMEVDGGSERVRVLQQREAAARALAAEAAAAKKRRESGGPSAQQAAREALVALQPGRGLGASGGPRPIVVVLLNESHGASLVAAVTSRNPGAPLHVVAPATDAAQFQSMSDIHFTSVEALAAFSRTVREALALLAPPAHGGVEVDAPAASDEAWAGVAQVTLFQALLEGVLQGQGAVLVLEQGLEEVVEQVLVQEQAVLYMYASETGGGSDGGKVVMVSGSGDDRCGELALLYAPSARAVGGLVNYMLLDAVAAPSALFRLLSNPAQDNGSGGDCGAETPTLGALVAHYEHNYSRQKKLQKQQ